MPEQNPDIASLYQSLCDHQDALYAQIQATTDQSQAAAIATEIQEVAHRIALTQNLLFLADAPKVKAAVAGVETAAKDLDQAIGQIGKTADFLTSMTAYLKCVDEAIDLAKAVAMG